MTINQINTYLGLKGLSPNTWIDGLEKKIPLIILSQEYNIFPNSNTAIYRFNSTIGLLEVAFGSHKKQKDGTVLFVANNLDGNTIIPDHFISYDLISGFSDSVVQIPGGSYLTKW